MPQFQKKAILLQNKKVTEDIYKITLESPEVARAARPGQFVMVKAFNGFDPLLRRPFSIYQVTDNGNLQLLYKVIGKGTKLLAGMKPEQHIDIIGPLGRGFAFDRSKICIVGGGIGVAPLFHLMKRVLRSPHPSKVTVLMGARSREEMLGITQDFEKLGVELGVATDDGSMGHKGPVTELMGEIRDQDAGWTVFSCGPYPMLKAVAKICDEYGWECQVSMETMMACGVAACLGCAIPAAAEEIGYLHTCKDGPVFDARELAWI